MLPANLWGLIGKTENIMCSVFFFLVYLAGGGLAQRSEKLAREIRIGFIFLQCVLYFGAGKLCALNFSSALVF